MDRRRSNQSFTETVFGGKGWRLHWRSWRQCHRYGKQDTWNHDKHSPRKRIRLLWLWVRVRQPGLCQNGHYSVHETVDVSCQWVRTQVRAATEAAYPVRQLPLGSHWHRLSAALTRTVPLPCLTSWCRTNDGAPQRSVSLYHLSPSAANLNIVVEGCDDVEIPTALKALHFVFAILSEVPRPRQRARKDDYPGRGSVCTESVELE